VIIDGVWIGDWIYWQLTDVNYKVQLLSVIHALVFSLQQAFHLMYIHQPLPGSDFQRWRSPLLWVSKLSPCVIYQRLTAAAAHKDWCAAALLTNSLANYLSPLQCTALTQLLHWTASTCFTSLHSTDSNWTRSVESYSLGTDPQRTPLAASLLLLREVTAYVYAAGIT
jgi:hypothetical protein